MERSSKSSTFSRQKPFCGELKKVIGPTHVCSTPLRSEDGQLLVTGKTEILHRWKRHFNSLLNRDTTVDEAALDALPQQSFHQDMEEAPTREEVESAIKSLKLGKAAGPDGLAAEFYQRGDVFMEEIVKEWLIKACLFNTGWMVDYSIYVGLWQNLKHQPRSLEIYFLQMIVLLWHTLQMTCKRWLILLQTQLPALAGK